MGKLKTMVLCLILCGGLILCSCDKGEDAGRRQALSLDTLEQPLWESTLTDSEGAVISLSVAFSYEIHGYYVIAGYPADFSYHNCNGEIIDISDTSDNLLLAGEWWVSTMTQQPLILKEHPLEEIRTKTLTLKRIETI